MQSRLGAGNGEVASRHAVSRWCPRLTLDSRLRSLCVTLVWPTVMPESPDPRPGGTLSKALKTVTPTAPPNVV